MSNFIKQSTLKLNLYRKSSVFSEVFEKIQELFKTKTDSRTKNARVGSAVKLMPSYVIASPGNRPGQPHIQHYRY